jgi:hypothetical protein
VNINVDAIPTPTNAPIAVADSYNANQGTSLVIGKAAGLLANDADADGNVLKAIPVTNPGHGTLVLNADGSFTYTPVATAVRTASPTRPTTERPTPVRSP